jgi:type II secretory ATPase GspE/PulE/Tfp pilus assembly ATPase PilB-like protein
MLDADDGALKARITKAFPESRVTFEAIDGEILQRELARYFSDEPADAGKVAFDASGRTENGGAVIDRLDEDAPVINLLNSLFLDAISRRASDIHVESESSSARVRYRIDGVLVTTLRIPLDRAVALASRLKLLSNLNVLESRKPQDGRLGLMLSGSALDVRISVTPTIYGESIVLRLLNLKDRPLSLDSLGFSAAHLEMIRRIIEYPSGLVIITGPTGSGKTTTLTAILRELNRDGIKIISLEDPVENRVEGVAQVQINEDLGLTFDALLRRVFRQDPDIIMIGEIRDAITAELAVRSALTGHLVFATLHTNSALEAAIRLEDMGVEPFLVASTLRAVIGQRLVRRICLSCSGKGCPECLGSGYRGRTSLAEIVTVSPTLADAIRVSASASDLGRICEEGGFIPIRKDGAEKVRLGATTVDEIRSELGAVDE